MKKVTVLLLLTVCFVFTNRIDVYAFSKATKFAVVVVDEQGIPLPYIKVTAGFEKNTDLGTESTAKYGTSDINGKVTFSGQSNGHVTYGVEKKGYYPSYSEYDFHDRSAFGWKPWGPELKIIIRKIDSPVPMYARNTKMSRIKIPLINKDIGFDLIDFDWVSPYGIGRISDFIVNLSSMVVDVKKYDFTATIKFIGHNGVIKHTEDLNGGSQYKLPRYAPEFGYEDQIITYDRTEEGQARVVSWKNDQHYIFRVRSVEEKNNNLEKAMYGKIIGDVRLGPQRDGTAYLEFKYYLNPDFTRNLEFDPEQNLFGNLPSLERVKEP